MLKDKYLNEMVEEQKQKHGAHERHTENTKTEQGKWNSQRKCQKNFTTTLQYQISQEHIHWFSKCGKHMDRQGKSNRNISARFVTVNMPNGCVLLK